MKQIVFATNNSHKLKEINNLVSDKLKIISLKDINCFEDIPETADTLDENASLKSKYIFNKYHCDCFADDTGLEVEALNGQPGVHSARYAGESRDSEKNIEKLLDELNGEPNRSARFRTVISLILDGEEYFFEGIINGKIIDKKIGTDGFGYDPIFIPDGFEKTFAQMKLDEKNKVSHRSIAIQELIRFLKKIY